jgi:eukaryotic-like serine/threonine-protein kinase
MVVYPAMSFEIGQRTGVYEFLGIQDNSRNGRTYRVRNAVSDRFELLRILPRELQENREEVDRFLREIKVHARLTHPNIVAFYSATELDNQLVMTSEFFEGITLETRLEAGPMPVKEAVACMSQILAALGYAHEQGVVHREISPANILIGSDGAVKLTGFGLAKSATDAQLTRVGTVMGWLEYMSPEQVTAVDTIDGRTDIYSAGAVLYEMVTGRIPFICNTQFDVMAAHVKTPPPPPIGIKPDLPPELNQIILKALAKDPAQRFQTAAQFREAIDHVAGVGPAPQPEAVTQMVPPTAAEAEVQVWGGQRLLLTGVFTFVLVAMLFFVILKMARP